MSLLTTLAYAITAAVRPRVRDAEIAALQAKIDDLRRELNETLPRVERQRDDWQSLALSYRREVMERRQLQEHFIDENMRRHMQSQALAVQAQARMNQAAAQQQALQTSVMARQANAQNAQAHQLSMQNGPYIGQQLRMQGGLGQQLDEYVRNCTPGRHELLTLG